MSKQLTLEYVIVSYTSVAEAENALKVAKEKFHKKVIKSQDLSHCEGNTVYLQRWSVDPSKDYMKYFLLKLNGAQPNGCHCKA